MIDDTLRGKRVENTMEDPAASCKEGTSRLLASTHFMHDRLGDHSAPKHLAEVVRGNGKSPERM